MTDDFTAHLFWNVSCINTPPKDTVVTHQGACQVGLWMTYAGHEAKGTWLLQQAIYLLDGTEQFDAEIALVRPLFKRLVLNGYYVPVTPAEGVALKTLLSEAQDYWATNNYANTYDNREEKILGELADSGGVLFMDTCMNQIDLQRRKALPVGLHEKPYRWVRSQEMVKEYS